MDYYCFVSYHGCELQDREYRRRQDPGKVQDDAYLVPCEIGVPIAFARCSAIPAFGARSGTEDTTEVEVHEARESDCVDFNEKSE